ncbi:hypothetical protein [Helicobacter sp. T3_23-1056]
MTQATYLNPLESNLESSQNTLKSSQTKMQSHKILRKKPLSLSLS